MKNLLVFALATLASVQALPSQIQLSSNFEPFVIGGQDAKVGEFPWQLSLQFFGFAGRWEHVCGAVLFSSKYALTAAQCIYSGSTYRLAAGMHQLSNTSSATIVDIASFKKHEKYNDGSAAFSNDIAVITLASEIKFTDRIKPAVLPADNRNKFVNESCVISGWGRAGYSTILPDTLRKGTVRVISNAECQTRVDTMAKITDGQMCIFDPSMYTSACDGDNGGPVTCKVAGKDVVAGVSSWVIASSGGNCLPTYPSAYTRFSEYLDWIKMNTP
ncbi:hypothetical protein HELRODRAFT_185618 [Helobdella robusta]|uniref:Peptidase S1 domain-containing protein n=1 Tax=Helobdella robusta TaxID=6412 RepID=T1FN18_HELRO|nr:hypothetical protein HELRODRAFT_185618 [Helobdella robusta]ESO03650.1 hypothetical protein HELRODRAFT_185618 [Helobdella robusta]